MNNRPLSIAHLVFGLIFLGAAGLWVIGGATDADAGDLARLAPAVLIGAGVIGLAATLVNARRGRRSEKPPAELTLDEPATNDPESDTVVLDHEEQK